MDVEIRSVVVGMIVGAILAILLLFPIIHAAGMYDGRVLMQKEAATKGFAEYNVKTGEWQWKSLKNLEE